MVHWLTHTHTRLTAFFPGLPRWAGTREVKPIWILVKQETVSRSGISWAICKSAPRFRQITTPAPHYSVFTSRMPFLLPNQQRQSTEGIALIKSIINCCRCSHHRPRRLWVSILTKHLLRILRLHRTCRRRQKAKRMAQGNSHPPYRWAPVCFCVLLSED